MIEIRVGSVADAPACAAIAEALPDHFAATAAEEISATAPSWVAVADAAVVGFATARRGPPGAAEITYLAVHPANHRVGIGTRLIDFGLAELRADGVLLVEVKTLAATARYAPYDATRAFWERCGFVRIDTIDPLPGWKPGNPAAIYVAALATTRS